jgi:hypothetical protein
VAHASSSAQSASGDIATLAEGVGETGRSAGAVQAAALAVSAEAHRLRETVDGFLARVAA